MGDLPDFDVLLEVTGRTYDTRRDALLHSVDDLNARLEPYAKRDWRSATMSRVLTGWSAHGALYRRVLADLDSVDVAKESRKVSGMSAVWDQFADAAATQFKTDILPLCWEALLKHGDDWPAWKLVAILRATAAVPVAESVKPVLWFLEHTSEPQLQDVAGQTLQKLPKQAAEPSVHQSEDRLARIVEILRAARSRLRGPDTPTSR